MWECIFVVVCNPNVVETAQNTTQTSDVSKKRFFFLSIFYSCTHKKCVSMFDGHSKSFEHKFKQQWTAVCVFHVCLFVQKTCGKLCSCDILVNNTRRWFGK